MPAGDDAVVAAVRDLELRLGAQLDRLVARVEALRPAATYADAAVETGPVLRHPATVSQLSFERCES